jgi:hypothetical protein
VGIGGRDGGREGGECKQRTPLTWHCTYSWHCHVYYGCMYMYMHGCGNVHVYPL